MYNDTITLVAQVRTTDEYGDWSVTEQTTEVFAEVQSIGMTEFYQAQATGLRPEIKFILADYLDYSGQKIVRYSPFAGTDNDPVYEYTVIRTYRSGNQLELTCHRGVDE